MSLFNIKGGWMVYESDLVCDLMIFFFINKMLLLELGYIKCIYVVYFVNYCVLIIINM